MRAFGWGFYAYTPEGWQWIADWEDFTGAPKQKQHINKLAQVSEHGHICAIVVDTSPSSSMSSMMATMMMLATDADVFYIRTLADNEHVWYEVWFVSDIASIDHATRILANY